MRAVLRRLQSFRHDVQVVIEDLERLERLHGLDDIVAVVAGPAVGLPHDLQLPVMSASRAGRNAEPDSCVRLVAIRRLMISPRSISNRCMAAPPRPSV